jgi:lantibiotic modifying enzyme
VAPEAEWNRFSLVHGTAGIGTAWLRLAAATGDRQHLAPAVAIGEDLVRRAPGPVTDWQDGATGEGVFLLRLAEATGDARFLDGAGRRAAWLAGVALRDERGCYWPWQVDDPAYAGWFGLSFIPGMAGIGHFLLGLYAVTRDDRWADLVREAEATLRRQAIPDGGGLNWPDTLDGLAHGEELRCQWCYGAAGVGLFFVRAHEVLGPGGAPEALATAQAAGETTFQYGDVRHNPVQCHGLAGNGELFLELYRVTREERWRERAHTFARQAFAYRRETPSGEVWQADDPGYDSPDFLYGASGTGHFFLRLWRPYEVTRPLE